MKMVKSLLLGSAAGLVAIAGAQAADLPVKAKPVQYVKICSLYGVGFYYIPGTDMCLKIGGWVREEKTWGYNGSITNGPIWTANNVENNSTSDETWRLRGYVTADARNQTPYGTVRSYIAIGTSGNNTADVNANRVFIQWAGFTFGRSVSFFDFYNPAATGFGSIVSGSDTSDGGIAVNAYTAQFGNGFSASISIEDGNARRTQVLNQFSATAVGTNFQPGVTSLNQGYGGWKTPDIVGNLRVDQAWGSAQIMGALHQVHPLYYGGAVNTETQGAPDDKWGFALGAGAKINLPALGTGDYLQTQFTYAQGATRYTVNNAAVFNSVVYSGADLSIGLLSDAVYGGIANTLGAGTPATNQTDLQLTTAWSVQAGYEHFWNAQWRTSLWGNYGAWSYNGLANAMLCSAEGFGTGVGSTAIAASGCDNNFQVYGGGSRTQWNVTSDFYLGLEVYYAHVNSMDVPTGFANIVNTGNTSKPTYRYAVDDQDVWTLRFRVHKDFYP